MRRRKPFSPPPPNRARSDRAHARLYAFWRTLPAYATLSPHAKVLLAELLMAYRPESHNAFELSDAFTAAHLGVCPNTARKAIFELVERGWIEIERDGGTTGKKAHRKRIVSLSCFQTEVRSAQPGRYEFWKEPGVTKAKLRPILRPWVGET
ncbi:MAG: hypothetical protein HLUCCA04_02030 [Oceanicaulis sp. HLUCCA04]|nr:MAG: hypothetical protein HLUCCA04_02030 [Oceanicaulis sp. HLUCCA04]